MENYISECIESILNQSFQDYELILVNDGSTDKSGFICDEVALLHNNVIVIHEKNHGLSYARNIGIMRAAGDYIILIDSDDYIERDTLSKFNTILNDSNNPNILITRIKRVNEVSGTKYMDIDMPIELIKKSDKNGIIKWIFSCSNDTWPSVRYIVKRDLIKKYDLKFLCGYLHEDIDWTSHLFLYAHTFTGSDYYWYNHRIGRQGSITNSINFKRNLDIINLVAKNIEGNEYEMLRKELRDIIFQRLIKSVIYSLYYYKYYNKEEKKIIIQSLEKHRGIFKYTTDIRHKIFVAFCYIFGFRAGLFILSILQKICNRKNQVL